MSLHAPHSGELCLACAHEHLAWKLCQMACAGGPQSTTALTIICCTAEQIPDLDSSSRQALAQPVSAIAPHLLKGLTDMLEHLPAEQKEAPINAIAAWLRVGSVSSSSFLTMPPRAPALSPYARL